MAKHVAIAGTGATGSYAAPLLARCPEVTRFTLVDPDDYAPANLSAQNIGVDDVGRSKTAVMAERLRAIRPELSIWATRERIEDVPRGFLRCDLIVSCVDSKSARQRINEIAWRLGVPWIDCGVLASQNLVRVNAYIPAGDAPCLECSWDTGPRGEYALLDQEYLCGASGNAFPSLATPGLASLAASLLAVEAAKLLRGDISGSIAFRSAIYDARNRRLMLSEERRNPGCRFDHRSWQIEEWRCSLVETTIDQALSSIGTLAVEGHHFAGELACPGCGHRCSLFRLNRPLARCSVCRRRMASAECGSILRLGRCLASPWRDLTLAAIGLRAGDIVSGESGHYLLTEAA